MATIANLQIDLSARTARFSEGLQRAQQRVQQFSQRVQVDLQRVTRVGQRAALVFSGMTEALTLVTKRAADYASTMDKVASQTGIAVEQIQELAFAANQSNADLASLESGLRAFVRRTAEAAAGNASFLKGFERLGFTQEQVRAGLQDIDGFLMQVADRVAELGTTAEQSAVLMTIMGDAGRRLVPFMAQGARGIRELREQARELGLVMDEQAVRRLAAFNDRMAVLQERTAAAGREMAVWFLPVMEAGVGLFEDIIGAIQNIDPALRAHAVRWTVVVGAVLGVVGVLGVLGTAVSQAGALLGAFGRLLNLVFSPIVIYAAIAIGAIALFRKAWEADWLGIRTAATDAWDNYIKPIWDALGEVWEWAIDIAGTAWEWLTDTTWAEKVEDIKDWLTDGWEWLVDIAGSAWDWLVNTTWAEKIEDVRDWLDSAWDWTINLLGDAWAWIEEHLPWLAATVETLAGWLGDAWSWTWERAGDAWAWLDEHAPAVTETIRNLRDWLSDAWDWTINVLGSGWEWLRNTDWAATIEQAKQALSGAWDWTIKSAGDAWEWLANWELGEVREIGTAVLNLVIQPVGELYEAIQRGLETGDWSGVWGATADVWRRGIQIAVGLTLATRTVQTVFNAIRSGLGLTAAGITRMGAPGVLGALSILVSLAEARESGDYRKFGADLVAALAAGIGIGVFTGSPYAGALAFTIVLNFEIGSWIGDKLDQLQQHPVMKEIRAFLGFGPTAEGEVLLRHAQGERFSLADRETFIGPAPDPGLRERIMLWFQNTALGRLLARGDQAEVEIPGVLRIEWEPDVPRGLGLPGYQSGTPWTGWGPTDEVAGVVHRREAVIPWDVLRRGPAAVLEFLGAPGFQAGYIPEAFGGLTGATPADLDPGFLARLIESVIGGLESRGIIDPETARGLRELADNLMSIIGGLYDQAKELWEQLGQVDLDEYVEKALRFREELEALGDVAEQERLAILARIDRLDELVEIERLVAQATGQAFDETRFRAQELSRAITQVARQMFEAGESVEAITETIAPLVEQLEPLQRQLEVQDAVATALERLAARLSEVDAGLAELVRSLRWEMGRGFRLDTGGLIQRAIEFAVELIVDLFDLFGSRAQELRRRLADVPDPGRDILSIADIFRRYSNLDRNIAERQRLLQDLYRQQQAITTRTAGGAAVGALLGGLLGGPLGAAIGALLGGGVSNVVAQRDLGPQIEATERQIRELEAQIQGAITDLIQALGIAADDFAAGIAAAFQEADITGFSERLRESVHDTIRQALIQAFVAQVLEPQITALAEMVQDAFLRGAPLDMAAIDAQIESIVDVSAQLYDRFEQLGLTVEQANEAMSRFVRNIPSGYRVERALFEVSPPRIPALAAGGIVTRPTLALVGEAGPEAVVPLDLVGIGGVYVRIEHMEVQDGRDFGRQLDEELRRRGLVRAANVTAWRGRR